MSAALRVRMSQRKISYVLRKSASGMTLVEILVVIAIITALAALIYPAIMDSLKKSQAAMIAQRLDAVQKAEVQYAIDAQANATPLPNNGEPVQFPWIQQYLTRFGVQISSTTQLNEGTGGSINLGTWGGNPYFVGGQGTSSNQYISKYNIPTAPLPQGGAGGN
jgi:prepilin-type N-terminal cleavage/methylation domain-containing protein